MYLDFVELPTAPAGGSVLLVTAVDLAPNGGHNIRCVIAALIAHPSVAHPLREKTRQQILERVQWVQANTPENGFDDLGDLLALWMLSAYKIGGEGISFKLL